MYGINNHRGIGNIVEVDHVEQTKLENVFHRETYISTCSDHVLHFAVPIQNRGLKNMKKLQGTFESNRGSRVGQDDLTTKDLINFGRQEINTVLRLNHEFKKKALQHRDICGYVVYKISNVGNYLVPEVVPIGLYRVSMVISSAVEIEYNIENLVSGEKNNKLYIFTFTPPDLRTGKHHSKVSKIIDKFRVVDELQNLMIVSEKNNSLPPLVTETTNSSRGKEGEMINVQRINIRSGQLRQGAIEAIHEEEVRNISKQVELAELYNSGNSSVGYRGHKLEVIQPDSVESHRFIPIKNGHTLARPILSSSRQDLLEWIDHRERTVCVTFGLRKELLDGVVSQHGSSSASSLMTASFKRIVSDSVNDLLSLLSNIYNRIETLIDGWSNKNTILTVAEIDPPEYHQYVPTASSEELLSMFKMGLMDRKTFAIEYALAIGVPLTNISLLPAMSVICGLDTENTVLLEREKHRQRMEEITLQETLRHKMVKTQAKIESDLTCLKHKHLMENTTSKNRLDESKKNTDPNLNPDLNPNPSKKAKRINEK